MKVIILAGGLGTRLSEETVVKPKPMVDIGEYPILWHIMKIYSYYGHNEFGIAMGYKSEVIKNYFINYFRHKGDLTIDLQNGDVHVHECEREPWKIFLADTGISTQTGGRIKRLEKWVGDETFMMTYGDGVGNIDINALLEFHKKQGKLATVTAVRPPARFGGLEISNNLVVDFNEKPQIGEGWINGGFFVLEPRVLDYIKEDGTIWEREPLEKLSQSGQLAAYQHKGYWQCMDTIRELQTLEHLWKTDSAPWKVWK